MSWLFLISTVSAMSCHEKAAQMTAVPSLVPSSSELCNDYFSREKYIHYVVLAISIALPALFILPKKVQWFLLTPFRFGKKRYKSWRYLIQGVDIIQEEYKKANGAPFHVDAPDVGMLFVTSPEHLKELDRAPDDILSLNGAAKQMLQPMYTMHGFNWFNKRAVEGTGFVRTLRTLMTNHLPELLPELGFLARHRWSKSLQESHSKDGSTKALTFPALVDLVVFLNARSMFGTELANDPVFLRAANKYVEETVLGAEIVKILPWPLNHLAGKVVGRFLTSQKVFFDKLMPVTEQYMEEQSLRARGHGIPPRKDCIQWTIETSAKKGRACTPERVVYELMALWFGSAHTLSTTILFVLQDLCLHPEYVGPLRQEIEASYAEFERTGQGLPLLDSFIKESARLTPSESLSVRRCALQPFTLSSGEKVTPGQWACAPSAAMNLDAKYYPDPETFSGFRFVDPSDAEESTAFDSHAPRQPSPSKLTDADPAFLMWGYGRMTCPGRFYASAFVKIVVAHVLTNYNITLTKPEARRTYTWRVARIPSPWTEISFLARDGTSS